MQEKYQEDIEKFMNEISDVVIKYLKKDICIHDICRNVILNCVCSYLDNTESKLDAVKDVHQIIIDAIEIYLEEKKENDAE
jgi:hypothetical protein